MRTTNNYKYNQQLQICLQMHVNTIISPSVRSDILALLVTNINLSWDRMPYNLVINYWYSKWTTLKMKAVSSTEILLPTYRTKWHHIQITIIFILPAVFEACILYLKDGVQKCNRRQQAHTHTQCTNSGIFILILSPNFQFSGCEMTSTPF